MNIKQGGKKTIAEGTFSSSIGASHSPFKLFSKSISGTVNNAVVKKQSRWHMVKNWFSAHSISKLDDSFVVSVKFASVMRIFVTGTSKGEVKLWGNGPDCQCLGVLNSSDAPWDNMLVLSVIDQIQR